MGMTYNCDMEDLRTECPLGALGEEERGMLYKARYGIRLSPEARRAVRIYRKVRKRLRAPCDVCGRRWRWWSRFHVHHKYPVRAYPEEASNARTFRWVHARCHLVVGHGGKWDRYQEKFDEACDLLKQGLNPELHVRGGSTDA